MQTAILESIFKILSLLILLAPVIYYIYKAKAGKKLFIRRIPGIDAIEEAIGRSIELGRPVSFTTGLTNVSPVLYAVLGVLKHVAKSVARYKEPLLVPQYNPEVLAIVEDVVQDSYRSVNKLSYYDPKGIRFLSEAQFAYASGYMGMMHREKVGSAFLFGYFAAESLILAEAGRQVGAMQVGASISPEQVAFFICACDYTLIGEELFAASAYLSEDPIQVGSLAGQDIAKIFIFILIISGILIVTLKEVFKFYSINIDFDILTYIYQIFLGSNFSF